MNQENITFEYMAEAIRKSLEKGEKIKPIAKNKLLKLEAAYEEAGKDVGRQKVIEDLKSLDRLVDVEGWE